MSKVNDLLNLISSSGELKNVARTGWIKKGIKNPESVADHTWRMSLMVTLLADDTLDKKKLLEMCIVHDLGEINIGDLIWEQGKKVISSQEEKHNDELKAFESLFSDVPNKDYFVSLMQEFNDQSSAEARFLKQIDKLEMAIQALEYEKQGYEAKLFNEFWDNTEKYLVGQILEEYFLALKNLRP